MVENSTIWSTWAIAAGAIISRNCHKDTFPDDPFSFLSEVWADKVHPFLPIHSLFLHKKPSVSWYGLLYPRTSLPQLLHRCHCSAQHQNGISPSATANSSSICLLSCSENETNPAFTAWVWDFLVCTGYSSFKWETTRNTRIWSFASMRTDVLLQYTGFGTSSATILAYILPSLNQLLLLFEKALWQQLIFRLKISFVWERNVLPPELDVTLFSRFEVRIFPKQGPVTPYQELDLQLGLGLLHKFYFVLCARGLASLVISDGKCFSSSLKPIICWNAPHHLRF